jgi:hypothetical protein
MVYKAHIKLEKEIFIEAEDKEMAEYYADDFGIMQIGSEIIYPEITISLPNRTDNILNIYRKI